MRRRCKTFLAGGLFLRLLTTAEPERLSPSDRESIQPEELELILPYVRVGLVARCADLRLSTTWREHGSENCFRFDNTRIASSWYLHQPSPEPERPASGARAPDRVDSGTCVI